MSKSQAFPNGSTPDVADSPSVRRLVRRGPSPLVLEQRFMFDGAAVADVAGAAAKAGAVDGSLLHFAAGADKTSAALNAARQQAEKIVADYLQRPDAAQQLFSLFNGGQAAAPTAAWHETANTLLTAVRNGTYSVDVQLRSQYRDARCDGGFCRPGG